MTPSLLIRQCRLHTSATNEPPVDILVKDGRIVSIGQVRQSGERATIVEASGRIAIPGLIDLHIQGAGGADVLDGMTDSLRTISQTLARLGTTAFLGTTVVKPSEGNRHLKMVRERQTEDLGGATLLGIHLEGPFINEKRRGAIDPASIYPSSGPALKDIIDVTGDLLKMMTIAPELSGNLGIIQTLGESGVVASFGHSDASYEEARRGFEAGIRHVTHMFNAMPPLHHRSPGPLLAIFEEERATLQVISDGHHLHPGIVRFIYQVAGPRRCVCITDGISGMGLPDGRYVYNGREYESRSGAARYLDGTLIGSSMSLWNVTLKFREFGRCSLQEAVDTVTINPARTLGIESHKGSLEAGKDADIVLLEKDLSVHMTIVNGRACYGASI
jgi:N-acetylglucosamine-6-phosphate deacetylase